MHVHIFRFQVNRSAVSVLRSINQKWLRNLRESFSYLFFLCQDFLTMKICHIVQFVTMSTFNHISGKQRKIKVTRPDVYLPSIITLWIILNVDTPWFNLDFLCNSIITRQTKQWVQIVVVLCWSCSLLFVIRLFYYIGALLIVSYYVTAKERAIF